MTGLSKQWIFNFRNLTALHKALINKDMDALLTKLALLINFHKKEVFSYSRMNLYETAAVLYRRPAFVYAPLKEEGARLWKG